MFDNLSFPKDDYSTNKASVSDNLKLRKQSLWNVMQVAEFLGVRPSTVRDWVYKRKIPFRKAGESLRFDPEEIERWTLPNKEK
jgi:excisionase family DNA binding protein